VLVVDDDHATRRRCSTVLQHDGYHVLEATNGQEGLELALDHAPDVLLLDISMPVLDGFEAAAAIAKLPHRPAVLMLTGSSAAQDIDRARRVGADGYVTKDSIAARLVDAIREAAAAA
jgi:CheY-like chemotaxis protein